MPFTVPSFQLSAFNCPHCNAFARMDWKKLYFNNPGGGWREVPLHRAYCTHCREYTFWLEHPHPEDADAVDGYMLWPNATSAPVPHIDMPEQINKTPNQKSFFNSDKTTRFTNVRITTCCTNR